MPRPGRATATPASSRWCRSPRPRPGGTPPPATTVRPFGADSTGVNEALITGVIGAVGPLSINDTRPVPIFETGQVSAVRQGPPTYLKILVAVVALLVVAAGVGLGLHNQLSRWIHSARSETSTLINTAKKDTGVTTGTTNRSGHKASTGLPRYTVSTNALKNGGTLEVAASSFGVAVVTNANPSWVQVTNSGSQVPVFSQVIPGGQSHIFAVNGTTTIETGSLGRPLPGRLGPPAPHLLQPDRGALHHDLHRQRLSPSQRLGPQESRAATPLPRSPPSPGPPRPPSGRRRGS